jgi:chemotaxis protein methyltransferase CheR
MLPNAADWLKFNAAMHRKTGLDLNLYKPQQLQRRILGMVTQQKKDSLDDFFAWLAAAPDNMVWFLDKMAINVSELFRNPEKWSEMETKVIPELLTRTQRLKCWSAGCSYGAEAYTLSAILDKKFPGSHTILGSDIDQAALAQAQEGVFSSDDVKGVPAEYKGCFLRDGDKHRPIASLKKPMRFMKHNLLADPFDTGFDLIMCRNVVIYFTDQAKDDLYDRFFRSLKPGGILFVGSTERIFNALSIGYETSFPFFYRKPLLGETKWRSAS